MALVILGGAVASASGSVGGVTFSRNRGGAYMRNRTVPVNPGSARQQTVRFAVAQLSTRWVETLTDAQRAAWETYAENVLLPNSLGQMRNVGGLAMYVRSNSPRIGFPDSTLSVVDAAPTTFDLSTYSEPAAGTIAAGAGTVSWGFEETDAWTAEDGASMMVFASRPQNPSVNFFKGPYQPCEAIDGAVVPPTSPVVMDLPFPVAVGNKVFFRCNVARADGRLASSFRDSGLATT